MLLFTETKSLEYFCFTSLVQGTITTIAKTNMPRKTKQCLVALPFPCASHEPHESHESQKPQKPQESHESQEPQEPQYPHTPPTTPTTPINHVERLDPLDPLDPLEVEPESDDNDEYFSAAEGDVDVAPLGDRLVDLETKIRSTHDAASKKLKEQAARKDCTLLFADAAIQQLIKCLPTQTDHRKYREAEPARPIV